MHSRPRRPGRRAEGKELAALIRQFLDALSQKERSMFLRRYFYAEQTEQIAARYQMKPETVRKSLLRTRKKLKDYLNREGYAICKRKNCSLPSARQRIGSCWKARPPVRRLLN